MSKKKSEHQREMFVGTYDLGYEHVRLFLMPGGGASTDFLPKDRGVPVIKIGADQKEWRKIVTALLHEAQEIPMERLGLSFYPHGALNASTANITFMMTHEQFDECCSRAAELIVGALPDLARAWNKWRARK